MGTQPHERPGVVFRKVAPGSYTIVRSNGELLGVITRRDNSWDSSIDLSSTEIHDLVPIEEIDMQIGETAAPRSLDATGVCNGCGTEADSDFIGGLMVCECSGWKTGPNGTFACLAHHDLLLILCITSLEVLRD